MKIAKEYAAKYEAILKEAKLSNSNNCNTHSLRSSLKTFSVERYTMRKQKEFDKKELSKNGRGYRAQLALRLAH